MHCRNQALKKLQTLQQPTDWSTLKSGKKDSLSPPLIVSSELSLTKLGIIPWSKEEIIDDPSSIVLIRQWRIDLQLRGDKTISGTRANLVPSLGCISVESFPVSLSKEPSWYKRTIKDRLASSQEGLSRDANCHRLGRFQFLSLHLYPISHIFPWKRNC